MWKRNRKQRSEKQKVGDSKEQSRRQRRRGFSSLVTKTDKKTNDDHAAATTMKTKTMGDAVLVTGAAAPAVGMFTWRPMALTNFATAGFLAGAVFPHLRTYTRRSSGTALFGLMRSALPITR